MISPSSIAALQLSVRAAVAAGVAVFIADLLKLEFPLYALVGAVIVTDLSAAQTRKLSMQRIAGTVLGASTGAVFSGLFPEGALTIGVGILTAMLLNQLLRLTGAAKVTGYVCGIVLLSYHEDPWTYSLLRLVETVLGILVAVAVSFVPKLIRIPDAGDS